MGRPVIQFSVAAMLGLIACVALNIWLFRLGFFAGFVGLNITKHVGVAVICQALGVNRNRSGSASRPTLPAPNLVSEVL